MAVQTEWFQKDSHEVLGLPETAGAKDVSRAYLRLAGSRKRRERAARDRGAMRGTADDDMVISGTTANREPGRVR